MERASSAEQQSYTSLVNVHDEEDGVGGKSGSKPRRRHQSLFSNSSAPVDLSDYPSMRRETSLKTDAILTKSSSGSLNWKLGELWSKLRAPLKQNAAAASRSSVVLSVDQNALGKQSKTERDLGFREKDEASVDEAAAAEPADASGSPTATSKSQSLHFISLNLFNSSKFSSSSGNLDVRASLARAEPSEPPTLAMKWQEVQGASNWRGLTDPLDLDLRSELLRYGDFAQAAHDNFESNVCSRYAGSARLSKQALFQRRACGYEVTRYLYAPRDAPPLSMQMQMWDPDSTWMGYVAVATDAGEIARLGRRDIVIAWRGARVTNDSLDMTPVRLPGEASNAHVESRFWRLYTSKRPASHFNRRSAAEQVLLELRRLLAFYKGESLSVTLTGHNLGGALAILTAYEVAERELHKQCPITVFTFGSPHIGDGAFRRRFEELQVKLLRVVNVHDVVPKSSYPLWRSSEARHMGVELQVDHKLSSYLRSSKEEMDWNDLEVYLHCVDGYQGVKAKRFELVTGRDYALVNKYCNVLQERLCVPGQWWQVENKGLKFSSEGRWVEAEREVEDAPTLANQERFF